MSFDSWPEYGLTVHSPSSQTIQRVCHIQPDFYAQQVDTKKLGFGLRLKEARDRKGLSGAALGRGMGYPDGDVTRQTISDWESERHFPNAAQVIRLCRTLGISADYLLLGINRDAQIEQARAALEALTVSGLVSGEEVTPLRRVANGSRH